jgi:hypothetical protein
MSGVNCTAEVMEAFSKQYLNSHIDEEIKEVCRFDKASKTYQLK